VQNELEIICDEAVVDFPRATRILDVRTEILTRILENTEHYFYTPDGDVL
jgi:hypothetical protein